MFTLENIMLKFLDKIFFTILYQISRIYQLLP